MESRILVPLPRRHLEIGDLHPPRHRGRDADRLEFAVTGTVTALTTLRNTPDVDPVGVDGSGRWSV
jgi:hypothetical protein